MGRVSPPGRAPPRRLQGAGDASHVIGPSALHVPSLRNALGARERSAFVITKLSPRCPVLSLTESRSLAFGYRLRNILKVMRRNSQHTFILGPCVDAQ